jgi:hypothetical protein
MRVVALGETFYAAIGSRAFSTGVPEALGGTPDISCIELDGTNAVIDTGATIAAHGSLTAVNILTIVATAANGYEAGKVYGAVVDTGTVDSVSAVGEVIYEFRVKTASELAIDEFNDAMYPDHVVATTTGNDTTHVNLSDIVPAAATADQLKGEILKIKWVGGTYDGLVLAARITSYAVTNQLAAVELLDGSVLPETLAAGDMIWRDQQYTADVYAVSGSAEDLPTATLIGTPADTDIATDIANVAADLGDGTITPEVNVKKINDVTMIGDGSATPFGVA